MQIYFKNITSKSLQNGVNFHYQLSVWLDSVFVYNRGWWLDSMKKSNEFFYHKYLQFLNIWYLMRMMWIDWNFGFLFTLSNEELPDIGTRKSRASLPPAAKKSRDHSIEFDWLVLWVGRTFDWMLRCASAQIQSY